MADFHTHISVSTVAGVLYGIGGFQAGLSWESSAIGGAFCSVSGMLPDLDSDSGIPLREAVAFSSAFVPMLMVDRLQRMGCSHEMMLIVTIGVYFFLRFGIAEVFRRYTVHRGMWHSIPAAVTACLFAFLASSCEDMNLRLFKTIAIFIGFMSHILLESSFGTALKFWSRNRIANIFSYSLLALLSVLAYHDEGLMNRFGYRAEDVPHTAVQWVEMLRSRW